MKYSRKDSSNPNPLVTAIIPCLNEEETLGICIAKIQQCYSDLKIEGEIVVGDNGSTDKSIEIAESLGARVVIENKKGYGAAIRTAVNAAKSNYLIMADADDSYDWSNLEPFIKKLDSGADLVMGNRFKGIIHPKAMPFLHKYIGNPVLSLISRLFYNIPVGDFHCGMRGFTKSAWNKMNLETSGMEFATEMVVRAAQEGLKIEEIPIDLYPDKRTRPPHLRTFRDGWRHLKFIMAYAPNYLFLIPGALLFMFGIALQSLLALGPVTIGHYYLGIHFLALGLLCMLVGLNLLIFGLTAKAFLWDRTKNLNNRLLNFLRNHFSLDRGIIAGVILFFLGFVIDFWIFVQWLGTSSPMDESIHIAFIASGLVASGISITFASFLLSLILNRKG
jgi:glycosyltransferase involved in cell wall biosynthesis